MDLKKNNKIQDEGQRGSRGDVDGGKLPDINTDAVSGDKIHWQAGSRWRE